MCSTTSWRRFTATCFILSLGIWLAMHASPVSAELPICRADQLTLRLEGGDGRFAGMSHNGVLAVLRNVGDTACSLSPLPSLTMVDSGRGIVARGSPPLARFMHPGPVVLPIELDAGAIAAAELHWIAGDVFAAGHKAVVASLIVQVGKNSLRARLSTTLWSEHAAVTFDQTRFTTTLPPLSPPSRSNPGTYVGEGPAGSTYLYPGDVPARRLVLRNGANGSLDFRLDVLGGRSTAPSQGSISGVLTEHGDRATFYDAANDCRLEIRFYGPQVTLAQNGECGFGNGATARGQYREI